MFTKKKITDKNYNFKEREEEHGNRKVFNEDTTLSIKRNEAIAVIDVSVNDGIIAGVWMIADNCECVSMSGRS